MANPKKILAIDIGGGTQDILIYEEGKPMENCVQMILPSPTQIVAQKILKATASQKNIFLTGNTMGGGPCAWAVEKHLQSGLKVYATPIAALTLHDDLQEVRKKGIHLTNAPPQGAKTINFGDVHLPSLKQALRPFLVKLPQTYAIALQDHGFNPQGSNRLFRFQYWKKFILSGGLLQNLIYRNPPEYMTRMIAVQKDAPRAFVMDTCAAAIWGILCDPRAAEKQGEGLVALNLGNQHTLGAIIQGNRIRGIFEHHTGMLTGGKLKSILDRFPQKLLSHNEIFRDCGHGCFVDPDFSGEKGFRFVAITGPRRVLAEGLGYYMAAPYGDMMLSGCFGLVAALKAKLTAENAETTEE
ncbi:MAG: pyruvate formate lyase-activating protein [Deltaproteobacteria bacterium]|nr:pyruvate formate lyase-activating protein [Deltaproteobacteria bacterium]